MLVIILFIVSLLSFVSILIVRGIRIECEAQGENTPLWRTITALDQLITTGFLYVFANAVALLFPTGKVVPDVWHGAASVSATILYFLREMFMIRNPKFLPQWSYYLQLLAKKKG